MKYNKPCEGALEQRSYIIKVHFYHAVLGNTVNHSPDMYSDFV